MGKDSGRMTSWSVAKCTWSRMMILLPSMRASGQPSRPRGPAGSRGSGRAGPPRHRRPGPCPGSHRRRAASAGQRSGPARCPRPIRIRAAAVLHGAGHGRAAVPSPMTESHRGPRRLGRLLEARDGLLLLGHGGHPDDGAEEAQGGRRQRAAAAATTADGEGEARWSCTSAGRRAARRESAAGCPGASPGACCRRACPRR